MAAHLYANGPEAGNTESARIHVKYNANDSDVTIESADGVLFGLHTQNLKTATGAFPASEFLTQGDPVQLTEDAQVLEVIFAYIYPQRHPNLENMDFDLLARIAEAVEKYEIFPAMNLCVLRLREFLPEHADDILVFAMKHEYPKVINESALALCRSSPMSSFIHKFPQSAVLAWIRYSESWNAIFASAYDKVESFIPALTGAPFCGILTVNHNDFDSICDICRGSLLRWVMKTENITSLTNLQNALSPAARRNFPGLRFCNGGNEFSYPGPCSKLQECRYTERITKMIRDGIANIPPFEQYLAPKVKDL